jgi:hypothetical protein
MKTCAEEMEDQLVRLSRLHGYQITVIRRSDDHAAVRLSPGSYGRQFKPFTAEVYLLAQLRKLKDGEKMARPAGEKANDRIRP